MSTHTEACFTAAPHTCICDLLTQVFMVGLQQGRLDATNDLRDFLASMNLETSSVYSASLYTALSIVQGHPHE